MRRLKVINYAITNSYFKHAIQWHFYRLLKVHTKNPPPTKRHPMMSGKHGRNYSLKLDWALFCSFWQIDKLRTTVFLHLRWQLYKMFSQLATLILDSELRRSNFSVTNPIQKEFQICTHGHKISPISIWTFFPFSNWLRNFILLVSPTHWNYFNGPFSNQNSNPGVKQSKAVQQI